MSRFETTVLRFWLLHLSVILAFSLIFRIFIFGDQPHTDLQTWILAFSLGPVFDLAVAAYSFLPFIVFLVLMPPPLLRRLPVTKTVRMLLALDIFFFIFMLAGEYFFYDEFKDRFNFIAVDYLVYTHEVIQNIWESYPLIPILISIAAASLIMAHFLSQLVVRESSFGEVTWPQRARILVAYSMSFVLPFLGLSERHLLAHANFTEELLAKNGIHALFAAYLNNEIKFDRFYTSMNGEKAWEHVHSTMEAGHFRPMNGVTEEESSIVRNIQEPQPQSRLNVVLVIMESMSAHFMKAYGHPSDLTPNLDRLARESLFYDRIYATGTRTVRGLEAVVLSIPPTPGQSIVRRPAGIGLFNVGTVFRENGYKTNFIYGGRALFDNMGEFFSGNGFEVLDQSVFPQNEIEFSNAWGISDEDLFRQVIKASDRSAAKGENFFNIVLTTSNHRPYSYPSGRVAIASGKGRDGAVQYSDFAIGRFLQEAKSKKWFDSTVFVFVADHNASVAGRARIDPNDYLIPLIFYAPKWVVPERVHTMGSQIDLAPTLLELLHASYQSRFFGMELQEDNPHRAFLGTYQSVGYLDESSLIVLSPNHKVEHFSWDGQAVRLLKDQVLDSLPADAAPALRSTVAFYKTASDWFSLRLLEERRRIAKSINPRD